MSVSELKNALHDEINAINNKEQLESIFDLIISNKTSQQLNEEEIKILEERESEYLQGQSKIIPIDKLKEDIERKYGF